MCNPPSEFLLPDLINVVPQSPQRLVHEIDRTGRSGIRVRRHIGADKNSQWACIGTRYESTRLQMDFTQLIACIHGTVCGRRFAMLSNWQPPCRLACIICLEYAGASRTGEAQSRPE